MASLHPSYALLSCLLFFLGKHCKMHHINFVCAHPGSSCNAWAENTLLLYANIKNLKEIYIPQNFATVDKGRLVKLPQSWSKRMASPVMTSASYLLSICDHRTWENLFLSFRWQSSVGLLDDGEWGVASAIIKIEPRNLDPKIKSGG